MRALEKRYTSFNSKLEDNSLCLTIDGLDTVIILKNHAIKRERHRGILRANAVYMIKKGFAQITELKNKTKFVLTNVELDMSVVGEISCAGSDIVIEVITVIDSCEPKRKDTLMIAV